MTDTPRVPDLRFHPEIGTIFTGGIDRFFILTHGDFEEIELPADAVKLGDVEELRRELSEMTDFAGQQSNARRESDRRLDALRADIRAVLSAYDNDLSSPWDVVDALRALLSENED